MQYKTVSFGTVGCRLNQYETDQMKRVFERHGFRVVPFGSPAEVSVINTCTVTGRSDYRSRQMVRRARRCNAEAIVVITGCYAESQPDESARIPGVDLVVGNAAKLRLPELLGRGNGRPIIVHDPLPTIFDEAPPGDLRSTGPGRLGGRTRAFLKIQDGCNHACAYCAVRLARGISRSRSWESIEGEARAAIAAGYREIVLTGVNLGSYGRDLSDGIDLAAVVERLVSVPGIGRIRLSSVEPHEVTDRLIGVVEAHSKVCRHFHLPLQSGSGRILSRMNRAYSPSQYASLVRDTAERIPGCGFGADVMVGFPGETADDFCKTVRLLNHLPMAYLHVFSYSPRPRTPAAALDGMVSPDEKKTRSLRLRTLGKTLSQRFRERLVGQTVSILVESRDRDGCLSGLTDNYVRVRAHGESDLTNRFANVRITDVLEDGVSGILERGGCPEET